MAAVSYHGEFPEGADTITQHGHVFGRAGESVSVADPALVAKFAANRFFKVTDGGDELEELKAYLRDAGVSFHHKSGVNTLRELKAAHEAQAD